MWPLWRKRTAEELVVLTVLTMLTMLTVLTLLTVLAVRTRSALARWVTEVQLVEMVPGMLQPRRRAVWTKLLDRKE
jgi:hypothetical protein